MDAPAPSAAAAENGTAPVGLLPEVEAYAFLLVVTFLVDRKRYAEAKEVATAALKRLGEYNRRTLDGLAARLYFYFSWTHECTGTLSEIRSLLLALHRTAVLRHDEYGQETLLNLLLRNYLHYNLYDQAEKLRSKAQRPEMARSTRQLPRARHVAETHGGTFAADKTGNLVARLRHNVIRAGLRRINLAYSRISLQDVAAKLAQPAYTTVVRTLLAPLNA
ncbi:hypothetical protein WJX81_007258 [Elliptochloris bilobata]|uniref:26S proteasome non-ATPase regulatory subunit 3 N-terminal TPR repeats domain-containing protein n=1 Tax=Elliptochloris bilobata TaxID=381761 RepID=A0AAW1Q9F6_9CHLO